MLDKTSIMPKKKRGRRKKMEKQRDGLSSAGLPAYESVLVIRYIWDEPLREWWTCRPWTEEVANAPMELQLCLVFNDTSTSYILTLLQEYFSLWLSYLCFVVLLCPKHGPRAW